MIQCYCDRPTDKMFVTIILSSSILLGLSSGAILQPRVASNSSASIERFPFTAAILYAPNGLTYQQACGGSILTTTAVLSAASCFDNQGKPNPITQYRVRVGSTQANSGGTNRTVRLITLHPSYNYRTRQADIAVVRVATLTYSPAIQPISIAGANYNVSSNDAVFVNGRGAKPKSVGLRDSLRYVQQIVVSQSYCRSLLGYEGLNVTEDFVCTARATGSFCDGDYGGPVVHAASNVLVGVASFSYRCAERRYPSLSTRVSYFTNWIVNTAA